MRSPDAQGLGPSAFLKVGELRAAGSVSVGSSQHCFENHRNNKTRTLILALKNTVHRTLHLGIFFLIRADLSAPPGGSRSCLPARGPAPPLRLSSQTAQWEVG